MQSILFQLSDTENKQTISLPDDCDYEHLLGHAVIVRQDLMSGLILKPVESG